MAVAQDTFNSYQSLAMNGQENTAFPSWKPSFEAEGSDIGFGIVVVKGTADHQAKLPAADEADSTNVVGVALRTDAVYGNTTAGESRYIQDSTMTLMQKGRMFVTVSDGSVNLGKVYFKKSTGEIVSTASGNVELSGARFVRTATAGQVTEIQFDL